MNTVSYALACPRKDARRSLVDADAAFTASCRAERGDAEGYFSANTFGPDIAAYMNDNDGSTAGYRGACSSSWIWVDFDREDNPDLARRAAHRLAEHVRDRYDLDADDLLAFVSGGKGYHLGVPAGMFNMSPHADHPGRLGALVETWMSEADIDLQHDRSIYEHLRLFRAPNSWHPSGRVFKVRIGLDFLGDVHHDDIVGHAERQRPFDPPTQPGPHDVALTDWQRAIAEAPAWSRANATNTTGTMRGGKRTPPEGVVTGTITPNTWAFVTWGEADDSRHLALKFAAANLAETCPPEADGLADVMLERGATLCGLDYGDPEAKRMVAAGRALVRGTA